MPSQTNGGALEPPPIPKASIVPSAVSVEAVSLMIGETL
jgi:hypothetical protein